MLLAVVQAGSRKKVAVVGRLQQEKKSCGSKNKLDLENFWGNDLGQRSMTVSS